jgi:hypothetical protein
MLAQIGATDLANGLATNPLAWLLVIAFFTIGFQYREMRALQTSHAEQLSKLQAEYAAAIDAARKAAFDSQKQDAKEQIELLMRIVPLGDKMVQAVEVLGRVVDRLTNTQGK